MHMSDALVSPAVAVGMYALSSACAGTSIKKLSVSADAPKLPTMAVSAALVFAGQMVNYTIPGTGSSGHICGGVLLAALLGPYAGFLSLAAILAIQCLFFADGGIMALGANMWNMGFYSCVAAYFLIWRPIIASAKGNPKNTRTRIIIASILSSVVSLQFGAFSVVLETSLSGITELPFGAFVMLMQPIHLAIGLLEGVITASVLVFVYESRKELIKDIPENDSKDQKRTFAQVIAILAILVLFTGGGLSLLASSNPDGLEWSLFGNAENGYASNMSLDEDNFGVTGELTQMAGVIQERTAFLPDYGFKQSESQAGTAISGIIGSGIVAIAAVLLWIICRRRIKK